MQPHHSMCDLTLPGESEGPVKEGGRIRTREGSVLSRITEHSLQVAGMDNEDRNSPDGDRIAIEDYSCHVDDVRRQGQFVEDGEFAKCSFKTFSSLLEGIGPAFPLDTVYIHVQLHNFLKLGDRHSENMGEI